MQRVNCYLCDADDYRVVFAAKTPETGLTADHLAARKGPINKQYSYTWVKCRSCGLLYANPAPTEEALRGLYSISEQGGYSAEEDNLSYTYGKYLNKFSNYFTRKRSALDIGSGSGFFLKELLKFGFQEVRGIEPSIAACETAPYDVRPMLLNKAYNEKDFGPGTIDFISCFQTLEHIARPDKLIESFSNILSKGGIIFCVAHNAGTMGVKILGARHPIVNAGHLTLFDNKTLQKLFLRHFEVLEVFSIGNRYSLRYWISLLPIGERGKTFLLKISTTLKMDMVPLEMKLGNIGIIARKN